MGVTAHYRNADTSSLKAITVCCQNFEDLLGLSLDDGDLAPHTAQNIKKAFDSALKQLGLDGDKLHKNVQVVRDCASNISKATEDIGGLACFAHRLSTTFKDLKRRAASSLARFRNLDRGVVAATRFFKQSNLNAILKTTLKQQSSTRMIYDYVM